MCPNFTTNPHNATHPYITTCATTSCYNALALPQRLKRACTSKRASRVKRRRIKAALGSASSDSGSDTIDKSFVPGKADKDSSAESGLCLECLAGCPSVYKGIHGFLLDF